MKIIKTIFYKIVNFLVDIGFLAKDDEDEQMNVVWPNLHHMIATTMFLNDTSVNPRSAEDYYDQAAAVLPAVELWIRREGGYFGMDENSCDSMATEAAFVNLGYKVK
jgi:hypothetical protein